MNTESCNEGIVKEVHEGYYMVEVAVALQSVCAACHAKSVCMSSQRRGEVMKVYSKEKDSFSIGEAVTIYMQRTLGMRAVVVGYLFPFFVLTGSLFLVYFLTQHELLSAFLSLFLTAFYYLLIWILDKKGFFSKRYVLYIKKKI